MAFGSNPAFASNPNFNGKATPESTLSAQQLEEMYRQPSAQGHQPTPVQAPPTLPAADRMTYDDVIIRTGAMLAIVIGVGVVGWMNPILATPAAIIGLVLGLVNAFKKQPSPLLITLYAAAQGLFIGGISAIFEGIYPGIVVQAVLATASVFVVTLFLFSSGKIRASKKMTKIFMIALGGYLLFSLVNFGLVLFGAMDGMGMRDVTIMGIPLGVIVGILAVFMAAYSLVLDFDFVKRGVETGIAKKMAWSAAFGLTVTLVWLYVEFLRLFSYFRD